MGDPHRPQNARNFPGDDSYSVRRSPPDVISKYCVRAGAFAANAEPDAR